MEQERQEQNPMDSLIDKMGENVFAMSRTKAHKLLLCVTCGKSADNFKDPISVKEYKISGMCQTCQDQIFR